MRHDPHLASKHNHPLRHLLSLATPHRFSWTGPWTRPDGVASVRRSTWWQWANFAFAHAEHELSGPYRKRIDPGVLHAQGFAAAGVKP